MKCNFISKNEIKNLRQITQNLKPSSNDLVPRFIFRYIIFDYSEKERVEEAGKWFNTIL